MKPVRHPNIEAELEQFRPLGDFVLVERIADAETCGSIVLPESARNPENGLRRGRVVAIGAGDKTRHGGRHHMHVKAGDVVIYTRVPANDVRLNGHDYVLLHEEQHILAVVEGDESE